MSFDQLRAALPDIVNQLATAVQVSNKITRITWNKKIVVRDWLIFWRASNTDL